MAGTPVSGPGRFARRTDIPKTPGLGRPGDPTDLQYGDVKALTDAQRAVPASGPPPASPPPTAANPIKPHPSIFDGPSIRPGEPMTTGLPVGPGAGPEALMSQPTAPSLQEQVLMHLVQQFGNLDAADMLRDLRNGSAQRTQSPAGAPVPTPSLEPFPA